MTQIVRRQVLVEERVPEVF